MSRERRLPLERLSIHTYVNNQSSTSPHPIISGNLKQKPHLANNQDRVVLSTSVRLVDDLEVEDGDGGADGCLELGGCDHGGWGRNNLIR